ncbi:MAG: hypothetical protein JXR86_09400 [Spirochaetales bacterium]|nr:hypothetical protein [Spirochaetales bacterium]
MKKRFSLFIKVLAVGALLFSLSGCFLVGDGAITVQVTNNNSYSVNIWYKNSASTYWTEGVHWLSSGGVTTFVLPYAGTYDFYVEDWLSDGSNVLYYSYLNSSSVDIGYIDYYLTVSSIGTLSYY